MMNQQQLIILNQIDNRDKFFKIGIVTLCLLALIFVEKEGTLPIIGTILGLVFGNNSMTDFFKGVKTRPDTGPEQK